MPFFQKKQERKNINFIVNLLYLSEHFHEEKKKWQEKPS